MRAKFISPEVSERADSLLSPTSNTPAPSALTKSSPADAEIERLNRELIAVKHEVGCVVFTACNFVWFFANARPAVKCSSRFLAVASCEEPRTHATMPNRSCLSHSLYLWYSSRRQGACVIRKLPCNGEVVDSVRAWFLVSCKDTLRHFSCLVALPVIEMCYARSIGDETRNLPSTI